MMVTVNGIEATDEINPTFEDIIDANSPMDFLNITDRFTIVVFSEPDIEDFLKIFPNIPGLVILRKFYT